MVISRIKNIVQRKTHSTPVSYSNMLLLNNIGVVDVISKKLKYDFKYHEISKHNGANNYNGRF